MIAPITVYDYKHNQVEHAPDVWEKYNQLDDGLGRGRLYRRPEGGESQRPPLYDIRPHEQRHGLDSFVGLLGGHRHSTQWPLDLLHLVVQLEPGE